MLRQLKQMQKFQQTEETSKALRENATQTTYWVIQEFMNRFNAAAEALKDN